jgi:hypothetical protein
MNVLVLNCGSSSVKFQLIATDMERIEQDADKRLAHGLIERIGGAGIVTFTAAGKAPERFAEPVRDTRAAVEMILRWAISEESGVDEVQSVADIHAVGHRVVHGGEQFTKSALITEDVVRGIEDCIRRSTTSSRCLRHRIPSNTSGTRVSLRVAVSTLSSSPYPALWVSWNFASLRRLPLSQTEGNCARSDEHHYAAPR